MPNYDETLEFLRPSPATNRFNKAQDVRDFQALEDEEMSERPAPDTTEVYMPEGQMTVKGTNFSVGSGPEGSLSGAVSSEYTEKLRRKRDQNIIRDFGMEGLVSYYERDVARREAEETKRQASEMARLKAETEKAKALHLTGEAMKFLAEAQGQGGERTEWDFARTAAGPPQPGESRQDWATRVGQTRAQFQGEAAGARIGAQQAVKPAPVGNIYIDKNTMQRVQPPTLAQMLDPANTVIEVKAKAINDLNAMKGTETLLAQLDTLSGQIIKSKGGLKDTLEQGTRLRTKATLRSPGEGERAYNYERLREQFIAKFREITRDVGVFTDVDAERLAGGLPNFTDSVKTRATKIALVRMLWNEVYTAQRATALGELLAPDYENKKQNILNMLADIDNVDLDNPGSDVSGKPVTWQRNPQTGRLEPVR